MEEEILKAVLKVSDCLMRSLLMIIITRRKSGKDLAQEAIALNPNLKVIKIESKGIKSLIKWQPNLKRNSF